MADLRTNNAATTDEFADMLFNSGVLLPLRLCEEEIGSVLDDDGLEILVVDPNCERSDEDSVAIATMIVLAVNTCGGFRAS